VRIDALPISTDLPQNEFNPIPVPPHYCHTGLIAPIKAKMSNANVTNFGSPSRVADVPTCLSESQLSSLNFFANHPGSEHDGLQAAVFLLTPLGLASLWRCDQSAWNQAREQIHGKHSSYFNDPINAIDESVISQGCLKGLVGDALKLSYELAQGVATLSLFDKYNKMHSPREPEMLASHAFNKDANPKSPYVVHFAHRLMRAQMADACMWAFSGCVSSEPRQNTRWHETDSQSAGSLAISTRKMDECRRYSTDWLQTLQAFRKGWEFREQHVNGGADVLTVPDNARSMDQFALDTSIGQRLNSIRSKHNGTSNVLSAYANICDAALGIYATLVVSFS
jgi:hypothetical protein